MTKLLTVLKNTPLHINKIPAKVETWILFLTIVVVFMNPFPGTNFLSDSCLYLAFLAACYLHVKKQKRFSLKTPLSLPFALFFAWSLLTCFTALDVGDSFHDLFSHYFKYVMLYFVVVNFFQARHRFMVLAWSIIVSEAILALSSLVRFYWFAGFPLTERLGFEDCSIDIIAFGMVLSIALSVQILMNGISKKARIFLLVSIVLFGITLILTQSRGALISIGVVLIVNFIDRRKRTIIMGILASVILLVFLSPFRDRVVPEKFFDDDPRKALFLYSLEIIKDHSFLGTGFSIDTFKNPSLIDPDHYNSRIPERYRHWPKLWPHNMLLSIAVRTGIPGVLMFLFIFVKLFVMCFRRISDTDDDHLKSWGVCLMSLLAMCFVNGLLQHIFIHYLDTIFYTLCAMITLLVMDNGVLAIEEVETNR